MEIVREITSLREKLHDRREKGAAVGFVPTMGALHQGHVSLVKQAAARNGCVVCSIFVNPTQFNEASDLDNYPRTPEKDAALLREVGCDILFMPEVEEIYPPGQDLSLDIDFGALGEVMEGAFRPGHFEGVATVVHRLLRIVGPDRMYMGEKDFQQLAIVRHMVNALSLPVEVVGCPTVREEDGLAMSSRNRRLTAADRVRAGAIYHSLQWARSRAGSLSREELESGAGRLLMAAGLRPEYFLIVDPSTLQPLDMESDPKSGRACVAAWAGPVRLIDNLSMD